ncbi:MAG: hypothetical protein EXR06_01715 [Rickettsiales bacterium]|nr:hypothetical protein [Rickettsiales bacterium]
MKIQHLRRNITINLIASSVLIATAIGIYYYITNKQDLTNKEIQKIHGEIGEIKSQTEELESQSLDARKYKDVWKTISENKKSTQGIKMDEVNPMLESLAEKYNIFAPSIQVVLPENLDGGIFQRKTLGVSYSSGTLSFEALSDIKAIAFISEFFNKLPGYTFISTLEMIKPHKYTPEDLINVSVGKSPGILRVKIVFGWYVYREKVKQVAPSLELP